MRSARRDQLAYLVLLCSPVLWSANHLVARWSADWFPPHALTLGRWSIAGMLFFAFFGSALWRARAAIRKEWAELFLLAALGMWITGISVNLGGRTTSATNIGLVYSLAPVFIAIISAAVYRERLAPAQYLGIACALLGVLVIVFKGDLAMLRALRFTPGDLWIVLAATAWAIYSVRLRYRASALDPSARLTAITAGAVLLLVPLTVIESHIAGLPEASWRALFAVLVMGFAPGFGAYLAYSWLINHVGTTRAGVAIYLVPLYNALFGWLLLSERVYWHHAIGGAMVLYGVYRVNRTHAPPPAKAISSETR